MNRRMLLMATFVMGIFLTSCDNRTCPTYTKKPANFEQLERIDQEDNNKQKTVEERV